MRSSGLRYEQRRILSRDLNVLVREKLFACIRAMTNASYSDSISNRIFKSAFLMQSKQYRDSSVFNSEEYRSEEQKRREAFIVR